MSAIDELKRLLDERGVEYKTHDIIAGKAVTWTGSVCNWVALPDERGLAVAVYKDYLTPEQAIAATLGRPTFNANLEQALSFMRIWISEDAHLGESELSAAFEKAEGLRKLDAIESAIADELCDRDYERKMDALLCRLTNGKFSKSRQYDLDFMESCVNEEFEQLYAGELADAMLGRGKLTAEQVRETVEKHWHDLPADYDMPESSALPEYSYDWQAIADELNAVLGGGECKVVASSTDGLTTDEPRQWFKLSCGHAFKLDGLDAPVACPVCGKAVKR